MISEEVRKFLGEMGKKGGAAQRKLHKEKYSAWGKKGARIRWGNRETGKQGSKNDIREKDSNR